MTANTFGDDYEFHQSTEKMFELLWELIEMSNSLDLEEEISDINLDNFPTFKKYLTDAEIGVFTNNGPSLLFEKIEEFLEKLENIPDSDKDFIFGKLYNLYIKTDNFLLMLWIRVLEKRWLPQEAIGKYNALMGKLMWQ